MAAVRMRGTTLIGTSEARVEIAVGVMDGWTGAVDLFTNWIVAWYPVHT